MRSFQLHYTHIHCHPLPTTPAHPANSSHPSPVPALPRLQTAADLVTSQGASYGLERCIVVDCRYGYEYAGGCIQGAVSINTPDDMDRWVGVNQP